MPSALLVATAVPTNPESASMHTHNHTPCDLFESSYFDARFFTMIAVLEEFSSCITGDLRQKNEAYMKWVFCSRRMLDVAWDQSFINLPIVTVGSLTGVLALTVVVRKLAKDPQR